MTDELTEPGFPETPDIVTSSDEYARRFAGPVGQWFLEVQREATLDLLQRYPASRILEVGGGHGQLTGALIDAGHDVTVLGSAEICRRRIAHLVDGGRCAFEVGNMIDLPYSDRSFDVVIGYRLVSHVERWRRLLAEMTRVASRAVIVDYPEKGSVNALAPLLFGFKKRLEGDTRSYGCFRLRDLLQHVQEHGFERGRSRSQFFLPMVAHRTLGRRTVSASVEGLARRTGLTRFFGSPVILEVVRGEDGP